MSSIGEIERRILLFARMASNVPHNSALMAGSGILEALGRRSARRLLLSLALLLTIASGLALRQFGYAAGFPFAVVKYGGSILWGAMVYWLLATIFVSGKPVRIAAVALIIAVAVEFFRLWHTPALDAFRLTTAGALLLGRVFSLWNIAAYAVGIAAALVLDRIPLAVKCAN